MTNDKYSPQGIGSVTSSSSTSFIFEPTKQEVSSYDRIRDIKITQLDNGYNVTIGCKTFAFESHESLLKHLAMYIKHPDKTETAFHENKLFTNESNKTSKKRA